MRVSMSGSVVGDDEARFYKYYGYSVICPADVRKALEENPQGETLTLELNSGGGSVFSGFEIYTVLRNSSVHTVAEVQSLAASAASTLMLGCDEVWMSPVAQVMIHDPAVCTCGNIQTHQENLQALNSILESILNAYEHKCQGRRTREELRTMMADSTWMSAQAAQEAGLADGILWADTAEPLPQNIVNAVGGGIRAIANSGGLPDIAQLRARYEAEHSKSAPADPPESPENPVPPAPDNGQADDVSKALALMDLEEKRYEMMEELR